MKLLHFVFGLLLFVSIFIFTSQRAAAQQPLAPDIPTFSQATQTDSSNIADDGYHEYTVYIFPTMHPLDWDSPSTLYKSMLQVYLKTITLPDNYLIGHVAARIESDLMDEPLYIAQASGRNNNRVDMVLREKVGYAILGATLPGRIETPEEIKHKLDIYKERNKLSFIKYRINSLAAKRIKRYFELYQAKNEQGIAQSDYYGGVFWPLYYNEGAGCTAFALAPLTLIGLKPELKKEWLVEVKIPFELMGGEYNKGIKVKNSKLKRAHNWYQGKGENNVDYAKYYVYEPAYMYSWVQTKRQSPASGYLPITENGVPGLLYDARNSTFDSQAPIFVPRTEPNMFIDKYFEKRGLDKNSVPEVVK